MADDVCEHRLSYLFGVQQTLAMLHGQDSLSAINIAIISNYTVYLLDAN